jgi:hypothetical protein
MTPRCDELATVQPGTEPTSGTVVEVDEALASLSREEVLSVTMLIPAINRATAALRAKLR